MEIYQIHQHSGEWEDYHDDIVGTYLNKATAQRELNNLVTLEETRKAQEKKCDSCPIWNEDCIEQKINDYCGNFKSYESNKNEDYYEDCQNRLITLYYNSYVLETVLVCEE